jgi:hypothetical protein
MDGLVRLASQVTMNELNRLIVRAQVVGRRGLSVAPLEVERDAGIETVRDLLEAIVREQVEAFRSRKREAKMLRVLTERAIADGRDAGRIAAGDQEPDDRLPDPEQAIEAALTAFQDGFYYVFINDAQVDRLDQAVDPGESTDVLFVRLTPLAGG